MSLVFRHFTCVVSIGFRDKTVFPSTFLDGGDALRRSNLLVDSLLDNAMRKAVRRLIDSSPAITIIRPMRDAFTL